MVISGVKLRRGPKGDETAVGGRKCTKQRGEALQGMRRGDLQWGESSLNV